MPLITIDHEYLIVCSDAVHIISGDTFPQEEATSTGSGRGGYQVITARGRKSHAVLLSYSRPENHEELQAAIARTRTRIGDESLAVVGLLGKGWAQVVFDESDAPEDTAAVMAVFMRSWGWDDCVEYDIVVGDTRYAVEPHYDGQHWQAAVRTHAVPPQRYRLSESVREQIFEHARSVESEHPELSADVRAVVLWALVLPLEATGKELWALRQSGEVVAYPLAKIAKLAGGDDLPSARIVTDMDVRSRVLTQALDRHQFLAELIRPPKIR